MSRIRAWCEGRVCASALARASASLELFRSVQASHEDFVGGTPQPLRLLLLLLELFQQLFLSKIEPSILVQHHLQSVTARGCARQGARVCTRVYAHVRSQTLFRAKEAVPQTHGGAAQLTRTLRSSPNTHLVFLSELVLSLHSAVLPDTATQSQHKTAATPAVVRHGSHTLYASRITAERRGPGHEQHH
jgi:hypothetical protein